MTKILLVEDNHADIVFAKKQIKALGYSTVDIDEASKVSIARALLESKTYDVVFLDYNLVDGNGTELLSYIDTARTKVIMLSGIVSINAIKSAKGLDKVDFVQKPIQRQNVQEIMNDLRVEKQVLRAKYVALCSVLGTCAMGAGAFYSENSEAFRAAFRRFLEVWLSTK